MIACGWRTSLETASGLDGNLRGSKRYGPATALGRPGTAFMHGGITLVMAVKDSTGSRVRPLLFVENH